ncbi:MAG: ATP-binding protein [Spirochaetia bacterium]|jgi:two-component system sensor histidine kinase ChvG
MRGTARSFVSRISVRVLAFNVLIVFLPIAGILSLGTYERQLLDSLERSLVQQGRVLAAGLEDSGPRLRTNAIQLLQRLRQRREARIRVVDVHGTLLADSSSIGRADAATLAASGSTGQSGGSPDAGTAAPGEPVARAAQETFLYRLASFPVRLWRRYLRPPQPPQESDEYYSGARVLDGPEIADALAGGYGAVTRITSGQQSVTLYSAIPVLDKGGVVGAVLISQSTFRILSDLYALRLDIFRLFLWSVATAIVLSLLVSATISVPIGRLRDQARAILDPRGRLVGGIAPSRARDEVGELSRSLGELTTRLHRHMRAMESFASDVSHEFKNPLASIRSAAELALASPDPAERRAMLAMVLEDVRRLERLLTGVREISRIDSGAVEQGAEESADAREIAGRVIEAARRRSNGRPVSFVIEGESARAWVPPERLEQVVENLVDNAAGFSPPGGTVRVSVERAAGFVVIRVCDDGPGIPAEHRGRIFDRFFSFRPGEEKGVHAGLGLAIVKAIAEGHGGAVRADNRDAGGACFEVRLPAV